jgi:hypothetical protein
MPSKPKRKSKKTIFETVRKPTPPPSKKIGVRRPEEKIHPSKRGTKHKEKLEREVGDADL